jgi:PAS domain S-box-containing protein
MSTGQNPVLPHGLAASMNRHTVQFYSEDRFLIEELADFFGAALKAGSSAVIIATPGHESSLSQKLMAEGIDLAQAIVAGRYNVLDAGATLPQFMVDGMPDPQRFRAVLGSLITRASRAAQDEGRRVVAFGEMVALLWAEGKSEAAVRLEKLWNQLAKSYCFSLRCAYPVQGFYREGQSEALLEICNAHCAIVPEDGPRGILAEQSRARKSKRGGLQAHTQFLAEVDSHRRQEQFSLFVEAVPDYAIFMLDAEGKVSTWNAGVERLLGYKGPEILHTHFSRFSAAKAVSSRGPQKLLELALKNGHGEDEGWCVRKDGSTFWASTTVAAVRNNLQKLIGFGIVMHDLTERRRAEMALHRSEDRFRLMAEVVQDYAIFMLDPEGNVSTWNVGAKRIKGWSASEIIGRHFSYFYPEEDIRSGKPARELEIAVIEGRLEDEGWRVRKDGSRFWANVIITPVRDESNKLIGFTKVTRDMTERMQKEKSLKELTSRLVEMQDEERRRIGRDLHDTLGQSVTAMKINLEALARDLQTENPETAEQVASCVRLAEDCVKEVRTISYLLYPPMLEEMGLKSAIAWYVEGFTERSGIKVTFELPSDFTRLPRNTELALFRILQEALTNVHRHSGSETAAVRLAAADGVARLEIRDQGTGIPASILKQAGVGWQRAFGVGLRGMSERLGQLGGRLEISSSEHGTAVTAIVPASPAEVEHKPQSAA